MCQLQVVHLLSPSILFHEYRQLLVSQLMAGKLSTGQYKRLSNTRSMQSFYVCVCTYLLELDGLDLLFLQRVR